MSTNPTLQRALEGILESEIKINRAHKKSQRIKNFRTVNQKRSKKHHKTTK